MRISRLGLFVCFIVATAGCHAQKAVAPSSTATPSQTGLDRRVNRRIELKIRSEFNVPPEYAIILGKRGKGEIAGYDSLPVTFSGNGHQKITNFLISTDNNTLARLEKFDLSKGPLDGVSLVGRPVRGSNQALVTVINFDDLECPFCARLHAELFPATMDHYKNQIRFIYKDDPLTDIHPWAMHAAVDVECLAAQSKTGYWNLVDYIHAHGAEISGDTSHPNIAATFVHLDQLTEEEGKRQNVNAAKLDHCIGKQDEAGVRASMKEAESLGIDGTPTFFINGERMTGALPQELLWATIDRAIVDAGGTPPPQESPAGAVPSASPESGPAPTSVK